LIGAAIISAAIFGSHLIITRIDPEQLTSVTSACQTDHQREVQRAYDAIPRAAH